MSKTKNKKPRTCSNCKSSRATTANIRLGCYFGGKFRGELPKERAMEQAFCETNNYLIGFRGCQWEPKR
jgi:hypothetical protein